ncbi:aminoacyl-tRNA hydrolase [Desulfovibrio sp. X2]|uniref:aminoacyl-tRNA hydrolase n=1 Tax=Desulfovibrio sp. X2 TaxID=941449 RepID=UPI0004280864|nr:aminoacyl-tRNA hydrolase [Desulfovibrio sp. X2]
MDYKGLIVGLGNPGPQYAFTRHNAGFMVIDAVLAEIDAKPYRRRIKLPSPSDFELWSVSLPRVKGDFLLAKPMTYMNLSGKAAVRICMENGIKPEQVLVAHDEMDLPFGRLKAKLGGGTAGHNGLKSMVAELGTDRFARLRVGIGRPPEHTAVTDWVLSPFSAQEEQALPEIMQAARDSLPLFFAPGGKGLAAAQQFLHVFEATPKGTEPENGPDA